jgi:hypothetical protein
VGAGDDVIYLDSTPSKSGVVLVGVDGSSGALQYSFQVPGSGSGGAAIPGAWGPVIGASGVAMMTVDDALVAVNSACHCMSSCVRMLVCVDVCGRVCSPFLRSHCAVPPPPRVSVFPPQMRAPRPAPPHQPAPAPALAPARALTLPGARQGTTPTAPVAVACSRLRAPSWSSLGGTGRQATWWTP